MAPTHAAGTISKLGRRHLWEKALSILERISNHGIRPDIICCTAAVSACAMATQWQRAFAVFDSVRQVYTLVPDLVSYNSLMFASSNAGSWQLSTCIIEDMGMRRIKPDRISYNTLLTSFEKGAQWERALRLLKKMPRLQVSPDVISYSASICACAHRGLWERAWAMCEPQNIMVEGTRQVQ